MTINIEDMFDVKNDSFSAYIRTRHRRILDEVGLYHNRMGVVGGLVETTPWRMSVTTITNKLGKCIDILMCLETLWIWGYRRHPSESENCPRNPWRLVEGFEEKPGRFSDLQGGKEPLNFRGNYPVLNRDLKVSRGALNRAISDLDEYALKLNRNGTPDSTSARDGFTIIVLYFAESLKVLPIRDRLEQGYDGYRSVKMSELDMDTAKSWSDASKYFLSGVYPIHEIINETWIRENLWLVLYGKGKIYTLDGVRPPAGPGE